MLWWTHLFSLFCIVATSRRELAHYYLWPCGNIVLRKEACLHLALFYKNSVIHLPSCQIKRPPQQEIPPVMIIYSLEHSEDSLMSFVTVHFAAICPWNLIRPCPYCSWKCRSVQFGVMSLNKSVILREGPLSRPPPFFHLSLLINTDVNMQMRRDSMEIDKPNMTAWLRGVTKGV